VLPVVRPERAAIGGSQGLAASISTALGRRVSLRGGADELAQAFADLRKPVVERLARNAEAARETYAAKPPTIIIPLDQAEELFGAENAERTAFCNIVAKAIAQDGNALIVATIRSDSYEPLQTEPLLAGAPQLLFNLPPIAVGSFQEVIEGPARLAKPPLTVEPALTCHGSSCDQSIDSSTLQQAWRRVQEVVALAGETLPTGSERIGAEYQLMQMLTSTGPLRVVGLDTYEIDRTWVPLRTMH